MIRFRHIGCQSEVMRYVGDPDLVPGTPMNSSDWLLSNGEHPQTFTAFPLCPDCGEQMQASSDILEPIPEEESATET